MNRKKIVAGNWKMNLAYAEAMSLVDGIMQQTDDSMKTQIVLAPSYPYLAEVALQTKLRTNVFISAQNCSDKSHGAYTGEVSASMLPTIGVELVIIGHSERRSYFHETDEILADKVRRVLENKLEPIFCCGETIDQRNASKQFDIVKNQLIEGLFHLNQDQINNVIIAYEPVWAIGTGVTATPTQAQEMHQYIRNKVKAKYGASVSDKISILYGGSVTARNASELFACEDVDGGLVGGASLKADEFVEIIKAMERFLA